MTFELPDYRQPPVAETALGVEFLAIKGFTPSHYYKFAKAVDSQYPNAEIQESLIASAIERFGPDAYKPQTIDLDSAAMRWWYQSKSGEWLLQLQRDRFVHNWRKRSADDTYPRYVEARRMFAAAWSQFLAFLHAEDLDEPVVTQWQVDYVNHLEKGRGWTTLAELNNVTPALAPMQTKGFLPSPEVVVLNVRYVIPPQKGRLHVTLQPGIRNQDQKEVLLLNLVARGQPSGQSVGEIISMLDIGHEWIIRGFTELTTSRMHEVWGRSR